jgi:uncharacterized Zn finger protein (UPF0148 family)
MSTVAPLNRTLEQELFAALRGASLECLVCGEFLLHADGVVSCPECGANFGAAAAADFGGSAAEPGLQLTTQAG